MVSTCRCGRPTIGSATLCRACTADLRTELSALPALVDELEVTLARQAHTGVRNPGAASFGAGQAQPLPLDVPAADTLTALRRWALEWLAELAPGRHLPPDGVRGALCAVLAAEPLTRDHPGAPALLEGAQRLRARAVAVIDLPRHEMWLGPCRARLIDEHGITIGECTGNVRAGVEDTLATCRTCGAQHDALARRRWLLNAAAEALLNATRLGAQLAAYGIGTSARANTRTVQRLAAAGRLTSPGDDERGHPTYRLGDVLAAIATRTERRTA